ncbi:MAG TPA: hypothetical protein VGB42_06255 [Candidatus Thermoplasmatota archaeon]
MDPAERVARAMTGALSCSACQEEFLTDALRDFAGTPVCVDCYRDLGLLTLMELPAEDDPALWARLLSADVTEVPAGPRRRFGAVERFASRIDPGEAGRLLGTGVRSSEATGLQEALWLLLAGDALARSGGRNGGGAADERALTMLLSLAARTGMDVSYAAMLDAGVARRSVSARGDEWDYAETPDGGAAGGPAQRLAREREAFSTYIRRVKDKADALAEDISACSEELAVPAELLARAADQVIAAIEMMERARPDRGRRPG